MKTQICGYVTSGVAIGWSERTKSIRPRVQGAPISREIKEIFKHTNFGFINGTFESLRKWIYRMRVAIHKPESKNITGLQNPLHDSRPTEFYVQCAITYVHEHENFRRKTRKGKGREG